MKFINSTLLIFVVLLTLQNCSPSDGNGPTICTGVFKTYHVTTLSPDGEPVDSVEITVKNKKTGNTYKVCEGNICSYPDAGTYVVMHDGLSNQLDSDGEAILVSGSKGELSFNAEFNFRSGTCHVQKLAGPDTVSME